jgi:hypothetical protein
LTESYGQLLKYAGRTVNVDRLLNTYNTTIKEKNRKIYIKAREGPKTSVLKMKKRAGYWELKLAGAEND